MSFTEMPSSNMPLEVGPSVMEVQSMGLEEDVSQEALRETDPIVDFITERYNRAKDKRQETENRWLACHNNHNGLYGSDTMFSEKEQSRAFIKVTKTKVQAAYAQTTDVIFAGNKFPIAIEAPSVGLGAEDAVHFSPNDPMAGQAPPGQQPTPSMKANPQMAPHIAKLFGPKQKMLEKVQDKLKSGVGFMPGDVTFEPAKDAAKKMDRKIQDQLQEANASKSLRSTIFETCLLGTGIFKGPFELEKEYPKWGNDGVYAPVKIRVPDMEHVSVWNFYPDPDANNMFDAEYVVQRHKLSRTQLRALKKRPMFRAKNIEKLISDGTNYQPHWWEPQLQEDFDATTYERWEVLEYWGIIDADLAKEAGLKIPKQYRDYEEFQVNVWISGDFCIRLVINPFKPMRIPYFAVPYEVNPYCFFGVGVAENMMDSQLLMNGFMRMAVDNAALSGNLIFEVNADLLEPGENLEIYPGKVFRKTMAAQNGQKAVESIKFENVSQENMMMFDKARQLADESTGIPSYSHGQTGIQNTGKTAAGMSMLMGAAAQNIKDVVRNFDDYLFGPLGRDLFAFNMQFNFDKDYIGEVIVVAKGTESLMRNELRSQRLLQFAQFAASNPTMAPYVKWDYILREYTASLDLDEDKVVNDPRAAAIQAAEFAKFQQMMAPPAQGGQPQRAAGNGQVAGASVPNPDDPTGTGNGNIAPGAAPGPGAEGFAGNQEAAA